LTVILAKAGIQKLTKERAYPWIPAFAGMTAVAEVPSRKFRVRQGPSESIGVRGEDSSGAISPLAAPEAL
jgi:hypothetical protein